MDKPITIEEAREVYTAAFDQLTDVIRRECPNHRPTQHRDGKAPWCPDCGRSTTGNLLREVTP